MPVTIQNIVASSLGLIDILMISYLGEAAITAVGIANQYFFIYYLAIFGLSAGMQIYLSQYWGDKNIKDFHKAMGVAVIPCVIFALIFCVPAIFFPNLVLTPFSKDKEVIRLGVTYLRIAALAYPFHIIITIVSCAFRSSKNPRIPMIISTIALIVNTCLNYLLIFGNFGFPKLGVKGAAIATTISAGLGVVLVLVIAIFKDNKIQIKNKDYFKFDKAFFKVIVFASLPIAFNELLWALGSTLFGMSFSRFSTNAYASYQVYSLIYNLIFTFGIGLAVADSVLLGNLLGEGRLDDAIKLERKLTKINLIISLIAAFVIFVSAGVIVGFFDVSDMVAQNAKMMIRVDAFFVPIKFYTLLHIMGTLRSGGDSLAGVVIDIGTMFLIGVPLAFMSLHYYNLPLHITIALISSEEFVKGFLCYKRLQKQEWVRNLVS